MSSFARKMFATALTLAMVALTALAGEPKALLRVDRRDGGTREELLRSGVTVVAELERAVLAVGAPSEVAAEAANLGLGARVLDASAEASRFALAGLREGATLADLAGCGEVLWQEDSWILLKDPGFEEPACLGSTRFMMTPLELEPVRPAQAAPEGYSSFAEGQGELLDPDPLVVDMLTELDTAFALAHWQGLVNAASTRYSTASGCQAAATYVYNLFDAYGLNPEYQPHTGGHAPNVIGTIPGRLTPDQVYILIGHLDDMPSSGAAPGADDNASGTVMVTALAELMSVYDFASTVKFIAVTGEEFGLYGSEHYADAAAAAGEDIQAVFNADMIGWQGNGSPNPENLDINYNTASAWMGTLLDQVAADYPVGVAVNDFLCNDMAYSDHWPFWQQGYSAVCAITDNEGFCGQSGSYPYYHTSNDTIANCGAGGPAFLAASMRLFLAAAGHLADPLCVRTVAPTGLTAQPNGANRIDLAWSSAGAGLSYEAHRAPGGCSDPGPDTLVGETSSLSLIDASASGGVLYGYTVRAKDPSGYCLSEPSVCVEAQTTGTCMEPPNFAGVEAVINAGDATCRLTVDWSAPIEVYCGGAVGYNVYRSLTPGFVPGPSNRVASLVAGTAWDDFDVIYGERYYYVVRAVDLGNGAEDHNTVELSGAPTGPPDIGTWTDNAGDTGTAQLVPTTPWSVATTGGHNGAKVYYTGADYPNNLCAGITSDVMHLGTGPQLSFWSKYGIESGWDKGEVQVSTNGGTSWVRVPVNYPGNSTYTSDACDLPTGSYFTGTNSTYAQYSGSLATWANQDIMIRWVLSTDTSVAGNGWWVDDITITNVEVPSSCTSNPSPYPGAFGKAAPANGASNQPTDGLTLSWNASASATSFEVCVDTVSNSTCDTSWNPVGAGLSTVINGLDESTTYSWQVRAVNGAGSTEADAGTWWAFTTEGLPLPGAFSKTAPANGATNQPTSLSLTWGTSADATSYEYCFDTSNNATCNASWVSVGTATSAALSGLAAGTTYSWQVRAVNTQGNTQANGGTWWTFITQPLPGAFSKTAPANGATNQPISLTLTWGASTDATSYEYCIDTTANGACDGTWTSTGMVTSANLSGLAYAATYSWQVRAINGQGNTQANGGTWWAFTTEDQPLPGAFSKIAPASGATGQLTTLTLSWGASTGATSYEYCIDTVDNNNCDSSWTTVGLVTSTQVTGLSEWTTYFWQVRAVNGGGATDADGGDWWSFITTPYLFGDGFESGDLTPWSNTVP